MQYAVRLWLREPGGMRGVACLGIPQTRYLVAQFEVPGSAFLSAHRSRAATCPALIRWYAGCRTKRTDGKVPKMAYHMWQGWSTGLVDQRTLRLFGMQLLDPDISWVG